MKAQKVRILLVVALLSIMMVAGNVSPAAAAQTLTPAPPLGCTLHGDFYPLGTVLHFRLPYPPADIWMRCEMGRAPGPNGLDPRWVYYDSNPS